MKARRLIESSSFGPHTLHVLSQAFDDAWSQIAHHFDGEKDEARTRLAHAVLVVAREDSDDPERIKNEALQVIALAYREHLGDQSASVEGEQPRPS
jgi:hypothetical protein